jgi:hypothetical protein
MEINNILMDGLQALELLTRSVRMVVVTELGPRIAFLGKPGSDNLFYWKNDAIGREGWRLLGGHRVWITRPGADESEDAYAVDNDLCSVEVENETINVCSAIHPVHKTRHGFKIRCSSDDTFQVTSYITNIGPMLYSGGVWAATCINPAGGKQFVIPLGDRRLSWDLVKIVIPRTFASHTSPIHDDQFSYSEDFVVISPNGIESKRMIMAPQGIIAMTWPQNNLSFLKQADYNPNGQYPMGCNLAFFIGPDNYMVEMETFGEEQTILPGTSIEHTETWRLLDKTYDLNDPEVLRKEFVG